jgi:hypothetical protein
VFLALCLTAVALRANTASLIAYAVKPEQIEAAREMTAEECRNQLQPVWTERVELKTNTPISINHTADGRTVLLEMVANTMPGSASLRIHVIWVESIKPPTGPERQRNLATTVLLAPGAAQIVARNLIQISVGRGPVASSGSGIVYVLSLAADPAAK